MMPVFIVVIAPLVNMPYRDSPCRQRGVPIMLITVFDEEIFSTIGRIRVAQKLICQSSIGGFCD